MNNELISIIVPIYNVEKYLRKCIDSIINQTYKNLEIILVNDGSTDNSLVICEEYKKKDIRIRVVDKENGGLSDARNKGIDIATGEYLSFIDSDDYIELDMIEELYKNLKKYNADISMCDFKKNYIDEGIEDDECNKNIENKIEIFNKEDAIKELILDKNIHNYAWNKLYKKFLFEDIRYPYGKKMEDIGTTYLLFYKSNNIVNCNTKKYYYTQRKDSIVNNTKDTKLYIDRFDLVRERYEFLKNKYPDMIELDVDLIVKIIELYRLKLKEYIKFNKIHEMGMKVLKDNGKNILKSVSLKTKIKIAIFRINPNLLFRL